MFEGAQDLVLFPHNSKASVQKALEILKVENGQEKVFFAINDKFVSKRKSEPKFPFPEPISIEEALFRFVDLSEKLNAT